MRKKTSNKFHLNVELSKEEYEMFSEIQDYYNIKNRIDVLRLCINDACRIMKRSEQLLNELS